MATASAFEMSFLCGVVFFLGWMIALSNCKQIGESNNRYPVFWNVNQSNEPLVNLTAYDILPRNWTQVGNGCSNPGCLPWTQGVFPTISSSWVTTNGGVPQNANLTLHLNTIKSTIGDWIPDVDWNGNAVFDFEQWTTVWDYNNAAGDGNWHSQRYCNYSMQLVQQQYPDWNSSQVYSKAKSEFESAATDWFVQTLQLSRSLRPNAKWGFYGLPLNLAGPCAGDGADMQCGYSDPTDGAKYRQYSDQQIPIWMNSDIIYPSIYVPPQLTHAHTVAYVNNTVMEALRCALNGKRSNEYVPEVYPYMWQKYHNGSTLLDSADLNCSVELPYNMGSTGLVIWGSTNAANSPFWPYVQSTSGPEIRNVVTTVNDCSQSSCNSHGRCNNIADNAECTCDAGYAGPHCTAN